ncbi:DUF1761 domain-containing protein [Enterovirga sp. GCM10030262]|uniref:DUF1761 domain-containing protein n=1 Tax=Enterovirga sp. GCM10030262 TaxID=3273391 RepID=UPI00360EFF6B
MAEINWIAAVAAGVLGFFVGGLWYSKLMFLKPWQADTGIADGHKGNISEATRFAVGITLSVVAAIVFAAFLGPEPPLGGAVLWGLAVGLAFITTSFGIQHLFEGRTARVALINCGYHTAQFALFGLILGLWH